MNKYELIQQTALRAGMTQKQVNTILDAALETMIDALAAGDTISIRNVGTISMRRHAARTGFNFGKGDVAQTGAYTTVNFRSSKVLRNQITAGMNPTSNQTDNTESARS